MSNEIVIPEQEFKDAYCKSRRQAVFSEVLKEQPELRQRFSGMQEANEIALARLRKEFDEMSQEARQRFEAEHIAECQRLNTEWQAQSQEAQQQQSSGIPKKAVGGFSFETVLEIINKDNKKDEPANPE
jgi:cobyrinic acid a,c-diamide synthase